MDGKGAGLVIPMIQRIPLDKGKFALVDDEVYTLVAPRKWHARCFRGNWYAVTSLPRADGKRAPGFMHRFIMVAKGGERIDHRDGDGLNNTFANLRRCTHSQNMRNRRPKDPSKTSKYLGVSWRAERRKWAAQIKAPDHVLTKRGRPLRHLGLFASEDAAARAYDIAAITHFGEFASTNFPREQYQ